MESTETLLTELTKLDIKLWIEDGALCFDAPEGGFDDELKRRVLAAKPELMALLCKGASAPLAGAEKGAAPAFRREAPATPSECRLAELWRTFLKTDDICRDDDFFLLGGHSLLLMRMLLRAEADGLGRIDLGEAMGARTLAGMAALIDAATRKETGMQRSEAAPAQVPMPADCAAGPSSTMDRTRAPGRTSFAGTSPVDFNRTTLPYPRESSLSTLWTEAVKRHAELTALLHGSERTSYRRLDEWAASLAAGLSSVGVRPGTVVAMDLPRSPEAVASILAILKCGAAYLPLDDKMPPSLVAGLLNVCGARWVVVDKAARERLSSLQGIRLLPLELLASASGATEIPEASGVGGGDPAYIMFTSGTTGEPKGVVVPHRAIARLAFHPEVLALKPGDRMAYAAPLGFDASTLEIWVSLLGGGCLVFIADNSLMQPDLLSRCIREDGVSVMFLTTSLFNRVADLRPRTFLPLKVLIIGGEVLSPPHVRKVRSVCPGLRMINGYGPTENTTFTTAHIIEDADLDGDSIPIGRPFANTRVHVLDEALSPVGIGVWGELCAAGDGLAIGYAGRRDLTDRSFVTLPGQPGERIYRTGDLARWRADGVLEFGGRRDGQVKVRGHRIETSAIEAVLSECEGVQDAFATTEGEGEFKELVAFVASRSREESAWRRHLADRLPAYMMPTRFLVLDSLPLNANGKKDRSLLAAMLKNEVRAGKTAASATGALEAQPQDFPLSKGQERLWFLQRLSPGSGSYNIPLSCDIEGSFDLAAFSRAMLALEERHHALRLLIQPPDGQRAEVRQRLVPAGNLVPKVIDLRGSADPRADAEQRTREEGMRPFNLEEETPARAFLLCMGDRLWRFVLVVHHIAFDGWSVNIFMRDLLIVYTRESGAAAPPLPALECQFSEQVLAQRAFLDGEEGRKLLERRVKNLNSALKPLELPSDRRRPPVMKFLGNTRDFLLDEASVRGVSQLAREAKVTPFVVLLSIVEVLLFRLCGRGASGDFAIGTLSSGREAPGLSELVGFFVNTLVVPCHIKADQDFRRHIARTKKEWTSVLADQHCPFALLVESLKLPRELNRNPLFDVLVVWQDDEPEQPAQLPFLLTPSGLENPYSKFDLSFHFFRAGRQIKLALEYSSELFDPSTIESMVGRLQALIGAVAAAPDAPLSSLDLWLPGERTKVLEAFNNTDVELPVHRAIPEPFLDCARKHPGALAVLPDEGEQITYERFARRAGAVAAALSASGVGRGDIVAVLLPRSAEMLVAIHGILMAGAAYVPLDPGQPPARLCELLDDLGHPVVLAGEALHACVAGHGQPLTPPAPGAEADPVSRASPDDLAYIIYTSGSTGRPKGVMIEHHAVLNRILWMQRSFPIGCGDVILQKTPTTFDVSVWELIWWSWTGAAVALLGPGQERDPEALTAAIERHRVTTLHFVPSMLALFLDGLENGRLEVRRLASLRRVFVSGEALDSTLAERFNRLVFAPLGAELHNLYGPTEATVDVSWHPASPWPGGDVVSIGRPIANTRLYILDEEGRPSPVGIPGEIAIGGVQVARGYHGRPELSAERFIADPFAPGGRLYLSGDLGRWRGDGSIDYLGRVDWQVKIRGQRIEPGEIEHALERHPAIDRAVVVPVMNQGLAELHAWLHCKAMPEISSIRRFLREHLPEGMIPARFFPLEEVPQTSSGKLDRGLLVRRSLEIMALPLQPPAQAPGPGADGAAMTARFSLDESKETLTLKLLYHPRLVHADKAAALADRYSSLIRELTSTPSAD